MNVEKTGNLKPIVLPKRNTEINKFYFKVEQNIPAHVTKAGGMVDEFVNFMERTTETTDSVTNENLSAWAYGLLRKFVRSAQLQKTKGFKSSQPVIVTFGINDRTEKTNTKFSINPDRMGNKMRELAELTVIMFEKEEKLSKTTFEGVESIDYKGRVLMVNKILKEVKETKLLEQPVINAVENMQIISPDVTIEVVG